MGEDTTGMVTSVSKIREEFKALSGVDIMKDENTFKSTTQIVLELADAWEHMTDIQRAALGELAGGKRGAQSLFAAVQNADIIRKTIADANGDAVGSVDRQMAVWESSIDASLQRFHVAFQELSTDLINSDFIKVVVDTGTTIIKIIDELVNHIGVLGTALTGLGIAKIIKTAVVGAKSVEGTGKALSAAFDIITTGSSTAADKVGALQSAITALGKSGGGAKSALGGLFSSLGTFLSNPITLGVGAAALAGVAIYGAIKKQNADLQKQASATTDSWNETKNSVDDYKQKYEALNKQLEQGNLSESERIGIKQQLLDLQNEIVGKYGDQVNSIDLVNGKLETQLGILSNISRETASRNLQDNDRAYQQSVNEMEKRRTYTLSNGNQRGGMAVRTASAEMQKQIDSLYQGANFDKNGEVFRFTGDASEFDEAVRDVLNGLNKLKESASESDKVILQSAIDSAQKALEKNNNVLQKYQDNYNAYLEQNLYSQGYGDELAEYAKRTQAYNDALLSGNADTIKEAKTQLDEYQGTVDGILGEHPEYGDFFDAIANSVDKTTEAIINFKDIIDDGVAESTNGLKGYESEIKRTVNNIKALGLDGVDVRNILLNGGVGFGDLSELAKIINPDFDLSDETGIFSFIDLLAEMGIIASGTSDEIDLTKSSFDDFMKSASASIDTLDKVNASLVNSFKSGGLSARIDAETGELTGDVQTILSAYKKELGDGSIDQLFERTANGITVNRDALRALQAQQENTTKAEFIERIKEAQEHLAMATTDDERQAWQTRLDNVKLLASAYDGATSAYQKWVDAQNMGEAGDQYDTIASTALKRGKELYDKGLVGTNEFRAIAQLYTDQDLALASIDEVTKAYEDGVGTVKKYFTEGQEGAVAFADKLVELGAATKEGDFYNFEDGINTSDLAEKLGISVDLVEAAFKKLGDYGFDIHFMDDDQLAEFDSLTDKAEEAQEKLKELRDSGAEVGDSKLIDIDLGEIDTVDEMKSALEQLNEVVASPEIDPESAEAYQNIIDALEEKLRLLSETDIDNEINFDNIDNAYNLLGSLQGRMNQIDSLNAMPSVDIDVNGDDQVQLVAEQIANLPDDIKKAIGFEVDDDATDVIDKLQNEKVEIPVEYQQPTNTPTTNGGTTTVNVQYSQGDVPTLAPQTVHVDYEPNPIEANVVAKLDSTAVDNYKPEDRNPTVKYSKNSSEPDNYQPKDKYATVNYTININGKSDVDNLPDSGNRYITYHINTVGSAPGNYKGTVSKSAFQGMSHASGTAHASGLSKYGLKHDENSLINELGAEIVVRPSDDSWMIFNNGMPTFAQLRKDDIIFNADQTRDLLSKGWTKNYASIVGGAFARGTTSKGIAHDRKAVGSGAFKKAVNNTKKKSGGGNGNGGGGDKGKHKSNKEAKDFKETLDEIEILIDRIERRISNLDTIASNTFNNLANRNSALGKSLTLVSKEIKNQEAGYKRYLKQANKVGLDSKLAEKVRNGKINIEDIKDEKVWKKVEDYRKW